jgi:protein TonB
MSERTLALAVLLSVLLHGGVVAWLYSLDAGRWQPPVAIVPAFPVTEVVADAAPAAPRGRPGSSPSPAASRRIPPAPRAVPRPAPASAPVAVPEPAAPPEPLPAPGTAPDAATVLASTPGGAAAAPGDPGPLVGPSGGYQVRPVYPEAARRKGLEGTTVLRVHVRDDGSVAEVVVARSAGEPSLDEAAAGAVQRWRFEPARRGGHPVAVWVTLPIRFRLE